VFSVQGPEGIQDVTPSIIEAKLLISPPAKFNLTLEDGTNVITHVTEKPFSGSGLSAADVKGYVCRTAEKNWGENKPFSNVHEIVFQL
jgi:hypothetical protein